MSLLKQIRAEQSVKTFFQNEWDDEKHWIHCQCVVDACLGMIKNTDLDPVVFILAGWLHDLGKIIDKENHHKESIKFVTKFINQYPEYKDYLSLIEDCIINHRSEGVPTSVYAHIFQLADKVAVSNHDWIEYKKKKR